MMLPAFFPKVRRQMPTFDATPRMRRPGHGTPVGSPQRSNFLLRPAPSSRPSWKKSHQDQDVAWSQRS